jgi:hypothetical protein
MRLENVMVPHSFLPSGACMEVPMGIGDKRVRLIARAKAIVNLKLPIVELLSEDSTPQNRQPAPDAAERFEAAALALINEGKQFGTALRKDWSLPVVVWELVE